MTALTILSFVILVAYIVGASIKMGKWPESLTELSGAFDWPLRVLWLVAIWGTAIMLAPEAIEHTSDKTKFLTFITLAAVIVYGMCARLKDATDEVVTSVAGWIAIGASSLAVLFNHWWLLFLWVPVIVLAILKKLPCWRFFVAVTAILIFYLHCIV